MQVLQSYQPNVNSPDTVVNHITPQRWSDDYRDDLNYGNINVEASNPFGIWTKQDQALFEVQMAQAQQLNAWSQMEYENWYNSPEQQARRQRMAGLNPDLQGIDNMSSASPSGVTPPSGPSGTGIGEVASMVGSVFSVFTTAMNIANGIQSFRSGMEDVRSKKIENLNKIDQRGLQWLVDTYMPNTEVIDDLSTSGRLNPELLVDAANLYAKTSFSNKRDRKAFVESVVRQSSSPSFLRNYYEDKSAFADARHKLAETTASPYYFNSDESMRIALAEPIRLKFEAMKSAWKQQKSYGEFQSDYYSSMNGVTQGEAQNDIVEFQASQSRMQKMMLSARYNMLKNLYKNYQQGNQFSGIMLGLMDFGANVAIPAASSMFSFSKKL